VPRKYPDHATASDSQTSGQCIIRSLSFDRSRLVELRYCGRQNVIGQMIDELTARIQTLPAQRAAWHNDAAVTLRFIHERPKSWR